MHDSVIAAPAAPAPADSADSAPVMCKYCGMVNCSMHTTDAEGKTVAVTVQSTGEPAMHTMAGVPPYLSGTGIILIIVLSHLFLSRRREVATAAGPRFNLFRLPGVKAMVKRSWFPMFLQAGSIFLFALVIVAGFIGSQRVNIGPVITWTWWWALLIFAVLFLGTAFCAVCPWEGISSLVTAISARTRIRKLGFELPWPKSMRNTYPAMVFFILLTWFELGLEITRSPMMTAVMALGFVTMAVVTALIYERRAFCRYLCLVGRIQGIYALFAPVELRPDSADVCRTCKGKECYQGSETAVGCPTSLFPGALKENTYCTLCTECVRACPHDNLMINLRPPGSDLVAKMRFRRDEAILAVVLLALTSFHGLTMTPVWVEWTNFLRVETGLGARPVFTVLMALMILAPTLLFLGAAWVSRQFTASTDISVRKVFEVFAYSVIPIALFYHLAHNSMHFFMEAQHIVPLLSDPFGWGWDLFGTAGSRPLPPVTLRTIWWMQTALIVIGHLFGVIVADRFAARLYPSRKLALRGLAPLIVTMVLYSSFSVWLIAQPMEMRSGM